MSKRQVRELLADLVAARSPNPPGDERPVAAVIEHAAKRLGLPAPERHAPRPERPNLLMRLGRGEPHLILAAHTDTMPPGPLDAWDSDPFQLQVRGDRLIGLGSADMKASIAAMLLAAAALAADPPSSGTLILAFTADEENGSGEGMAWMCERGLISGDGAVMVEPSSAGPASWEALYVAQRGSCVARLVASGRPGHSGEAIDPSERAGTAFALSLAALVDADPFSAWSHPVDGTRPIVNVATMVRGGMVPFAHPATLEAIIEVRTITGMSQADVLGGLKRVVAAAGLDGRVKIEPAPAPSWIPAGRTVTDERLLRPARSAWRHVLGTTAQESVYPAGTDSSHLDALGIPALPAFGPGTLAVAHRPNEFVPASDVDRAVALFESFVRRYFEEGRQ
jgi:acetylornithine deacetylase/succinyl-diaminopimelate desuccinylase-like protein